jgi:TetR/AcrR family transcriptional regulator, transcriptional repressor for nem operon
MRPMPTTTRGRQSRAKIVAAAAKLMHERGLAAPSMDDVLAASGTGKSQLYHYFDGKQDLAVAVLRHQFDGVMAAQSSLTDPACDDLMRWRDEVVEAHRSHGLGTCPLGAFAGQVDTDPLLRETLAHLFTRWEAAIGELVARALRAGRVSPATRPDAAGRALLITLEGGTMLAHLHRDSLSLARALDNAIAELGWMPAREA